VKVVIAGASGFVGTALSESLKSAGHTPVALVRHAATGPDEIEWEPAAGKLDAASLSGYDAVVCLSGESIAGVRWTEEKKQAIKKSRIDCVGLLAQRMAEMDQPPPVFVCASAMGYYGDSGDATLTEDSPPGDDFLAAVCKDWEAAADPARGKGIRVTHLRFGLILSDEGGALKTMLTPFRLGLGGVVGDGEQYISWITIEDVVAIVRYAIDTPSLEGPVNTASPNPVTNREFTKALGHALHRPTVVPLPEFVVKAAMGEMGEALLLASYRMVPEKLLRSGYAFMHPTIDAAFHHLLAE
jgi:hypothetical protein